MTRPVADMNVGTTKREVRFARVQRFAVVITIFLAIALSTLTLVVVELRSDAIESGRDYAVNLASVLAEGVQNSLQAIDASLLDVTKIVKAQSPEQFAARMSDPFMKNFLAGKHGLVPKDGIVAVANADGEVVAESVPRGNLRFNILDRAYFQTLRDNPEAGLVISKPLARKLDNALTIFFARRLSTPDGRFLGIVFVGIEPDKIVSSRPNTSAVGGVSYSVIARDGSVLFRNPQVGAAFPKTSPSNSEWFEVVARGGGIYHSPGVFDATPRSVAVEPLKGYPIVVDVAIADDAVLAKWRQRSATIVVAAVACLALVIGLLYWQLHLDALLTRSAIKSRLRGRALQRNSSRLTEARKRLGVILDHMSQGMAIFDTNNKLLVANERYAELYGLRGEQLAAGMPARDIFTLRISTGAYALASPEAYLSLAGQRHVGERIDHLRNGRSILVRDRELDDGRVTIHEDVTERVTAEQEMAAMALHDSLTQLFNRQACMHFLNDMTHHPRASVLAVLLLDIDGFKQVNDTFGHEIGDRVLVEVARRIQRVAAGHFVARLGGDEFLVVMSSPDLEAVEVHELVDRLVAAAQEHLDIDGRQIGIGLCAGIHVSNHQGADSASLLRRADLALYAAKDCGRGQVRMFDESMELRFLERAALGLALSDAIDNERLEVFYQPIVCASHRNKVVCMEALVRWRHPDRGMISPLAFIPIAEENGLIGALGKWVLKRACRDASAWRDDIVVAVNVSALQFEASHFVEDVVQILADSALPSNRLQLEITESTLLQNGQMTRGALQRLHSLGVTFALDDFGTGYASLAYLKVVPLDKIKIDKRFVDDIEVNSQSIAIVSAIVALARSLNIETTAEGVETIAQYVALRELGVKTMQGYLFSRPKPITEHEAAIFGATPARRLSQVAI